MTFVPVANAEYPDKPLEFLIHASPGGGSDMFCRAIAKALDKEGLVKQKINVISRRGGGGTLALNYLATKKGNPNVLMHFTTSPLITLAIRKSSKLGFDDVTYVAKMAEFPNLVFTKYDSPYKTLQDIVAAGRKAPPKTLSSGMSTTGGSEHILAHRIGRESGFDLNIVAFGSGGKVTAALLGGHIDMMIGNIEEQLGQVEAKRTRALATVTEKRIPYFPDLPTAKEQGVDVVYTQVRGFIAPPDFPDYALKYWEDIFAKLVKTQSYKDLMKANFGVEAYTNGAGYKEFLVDYVTAFKQDVEELGLFKKKK
jgi:putative tricarboxylic transport membrane protein